ncbi:hypothetical protein HNY73_014140 [Argiope bruennichi]|uniref:Uncharacterized protein n=1 Tax=Argiope bruennichi TaxID=94029 RepID=A0A8T0EPD5_ARGBR|nr:hypothetical protein HNY73_014140 [Argiope bruennichi]
MDQPSPADVMDLDNMDPIAKSDEIKRCKDAIFHGKKEVTKVRYMIRKDPNSRELAALEKKAQQELNKLYERFQILTINQHQGPRNDPDQPAPRPTTKSVVFRGLHHPKKLHRRTQIHTTHEDYECRRLHTSIPKENSEENSLYN